MSNPSSAIGRVLAAVLAITGLVGLVVSLLISSMPKGGPRQIAGYQPWSPEVLAVAETLPLQDGGRIKPLSAHAGFTMLAIHGSRTMKVADAEGRTFRLGPTAWLLDTLFRPELAIKQPVFRLDNSAVLEAIGLKAGHKRDRYSYEQIQPGLEKLWELASSYEPVPPKQRNALQQQILDFAYNVRDYLALLQHLNFARQGIVVDDQGGQPPLDLATTLEMAPKIREDLTKARQAGQQPTGPASYLYNEAFNAANLASRGMYLFPPAERAAASWPNAGDLISGVLNGEIQPAAPAIKDIRALEAACKALPSGQAAFLTQLTSLRDDLSQRAGSRGEGRWVRLEASYHRMDWFLKAFILFALGGLTAIAMWLARRPRAGTALAWTTLALTASAWLLCAIAITQRCLIMQRSPIGNLYDTIIFIATAGVLLALVVELFLRRRLALGLAPILGMVLVYLSRRFEVGDPKDHLDPLVAVLSSNFWLTIHVITITLGYAAGLLAALLSTIYILMRGLRLDQGDKDLRKALTMVTYGMVCLTLFLSLVGTVLGGIWANDSWGRFWGWDPKENGALLIVIWTLVILHARLGGYLREWGFHLATAFTACVIAFSWWHVNFLGVGLHNYGFTTGKSVVWAFYGGMLTILTFGGVAWALEKRGAEKV